MYLHIESYLHLAEMLKRSVAIMMSVVGEGNRV